MQKLAILQSGFVSLSEDRLTIPRALNDQYTDVVLNKAHLKNKNFYFYSEDVTKLYKDFCANKKLLNDFDFRENILILANKLFRGSLTGLGSGTFSKWLNAQNSSPFLSELHIKFLEETSDYVWTLGNTDRSVHISQWSRLLNCQNTAKNTEINVKKFLDRSSLTRTSNDNITNLIINWTSIPLGFEDLLISLYVIFGSRTEITEITDVKFR